jgi:hypothetical protein
MQRERARGHCCFYWIAVTLSHSEAEARIAVIKTAIMDQAENSLPLCAY